jgi:hypothetical protein
LYFRSEFGCLTVESCSVSLLRFSCAASIRKLGYNSVYTLQLNFSGTITIVDDNGCEYKSPRTRIETPPF